MKMEKCHSSQWLGSASREVQGNHPEYCFLPRIAALELSEPPRGAAPGVDAARGIHALRRDQSGDAHFMLHFTRGAATPGIDLRALGLWDDALSASASTRVVLSCVPDALVPAAARALVACGRAATFRERCLTWEPEPGSVCSSGDPAALLAAAQAALPPGYTLCSVRPEEAGMVDLAWKYRCEGVTLRMVEECIAARPSVCIRSAAGGAPVCWSVLRSDCSWGLLYTLPEHRRRGLSKAAMLAGFARQRAWALGLADADQRRLACAATPYVHIARWNEASAGLFKSLGFVPTASATWVISAALAPRYTLRPLRLSSSSEVDALLAHINASYRQDDAFFVDQQRTTLESLLGMAKEGVFFVGFEALAGAGQAGLGSAAHPHALPSSSSAACAEEALGQEEGTQLLASVYLKITPAPAAGGSQGSAAAPGNAAAAVEAAVEAAAATPFSSDSRRAEGGGGLAQRSRPAAAQPLLPSPWPPPWPRGPQPPSPSSPLRPLPSAWGWGSACWTFAWPPAGKRTAAQRQRCLLSASSPGCWPFMSTMASRWWARTAGPRF